MTQDKGGWQFAIPDTRISMDNKPRPRGALTLAWMPEQDVGGINGKRSDELRIRASNLDSTAIEGLRSMAAKLSPELGEIWLATQPSGQIKPAGAGYSAPCHGKDAFSGGMEKSRMETVETAAGCRALQR